MMATQNEKLLVHLLATQAKKIKLMLSKGAVEYLAEAIGNDMTRAATELRKLYIYGKGRQLEFAQVKELVPCQTQNSLQLASAIRQGKAIKFCTCWMIYCHARNN